jgi:surface polysaccharide O-acyltransferase-like enzyme
MSHRPAGPVRADSATATAPRRPSGQKDSLAWISWLRVVAIGAVVLIHVGGMTASAPDARSTAQGQLGIVLDFASRWCVPVFVMVSGALLLDPARYRGSADFLRRRAMRLVPAVVVWHLVYLGYILAFTDTPLSLHDALQRTLTGRLWTALYFFWIVIGLAVITPVLIPWIASVSRRSVLLVGLVAAAVPALTVVTVPVRTDVLWRADMSWVETPWTWWIPYLGYYLLGYALRNVVLTRWRLLLPAIGAVGGSVLLIWQWGRSAGLGGALERYLPAEAYYSPTVIVIAISVFLLAQGLIRPSGPLSALCRPAPALAGRRLGDSTLGVFAVHLLVLEVVLRLPLIGGDRAAESVGELLARCLMVFVVAYLIALLANRVPVLRRLF